MRVGAGPIDPTAGAAAVEPVMNLGNIVGNRPDDLVSGHILQPLIASAAAVQRRKIASLQRQSAHDLTHLCQRTVMVNEDDLITAQCLFHTPAAGKNDTLAMGKFPQTSRLRNCRIVEGVDAGQAQVCDKFSQSGIGNQAR